MQVFSEAAFTERERADSARRELESLRKLNNLLQERLKSSDTDWNDSYEEVMQEEMAMMRETYEAKLKLMSEDMKELRTTHSSEIQSLRDRTERRRL